MVQPDPGLPVTKPVSVWNRPLKADFKGLFGSLTRAALHGATGQWTEVGADAADGLTALGLGQDVSQLSWVLIRRALLSAMSDLVKESEPLREEPDKAELEALSKRLDEAIEQAEVTLAQSFFERPANLPLLQQVQAPFSEWLQGCGLPAAAATSTAARLPSYFVYALHSDWRQNAGSYEPIRAAVESPFTAAAERERAWQLYAARLHRQVDEPMFGEAFGLRQVYVPLRAFYDEEEKGAHSVGGAGPLGQERVKRRVAVDLEQEIDEWVERGAKADSYRIISGGPGSGKSSFSKMYAAKTAGGYLRVLFIPLHQFNVTGSLPASVGEFVRSAEILPDNPLEPGGGEDRLLIIFDGLDELSQQGRFAAEVARDFLREVQKTVELRNQQRRRLLVLVTGREPVVQASETEIRDRERILHALAYYLSGAEAMRMTWKGSVQEHIGEDQRNVWWRLYGVATGKGYPALPKELARPDLSEITSQPLLNYLVALSYGRGRLNFSKELNLNDVYADLLEAVYSRTYEGKRQHYAIRGMRYQEFTRVLEEIALASWHGNGRTTTVSDIEAHCKAANLSSLLDRFEEGAKVGVTRVLTAFYFREFSGTSAGERTFEFTHKSFREYLTALRIVRAVQRMEDELGRQKENLDSGWSERDALQHWAEICGPTAMDLDLSPFVNNQVRRVGSERAAKWQTMLCRLISFVLRSGIPMEKLSPRPSYLIESRQARNAEEALLALLSSCALTTGELSRIEWLLEEGKMDSMLETDGSPAAAMGAWVNRLRGQRTGTNNRLALNCLCLLDLSYCVLYMCDLYGANLNGCKLIGSFMSSSNLGSANLAGADLTGADLASANLTGANLVGANLAGAKLGGARLEGANLEGAKLDYLALAGTHGRPVGRPIIIERRK